MISVSPMYSYQSLQAEAEEAIRKKQMKRKSKRFREREISAVSLLTLKMEGPTSQ